MKESIKKLLEKAKRFDKNYVFRCANMSLSAVPLSITKSHPA